MFKHLVTSVVVRSVVPVVTLLLLVLAAAPAAAQSTASWTERIRVSGDLRQRMEGFFQEDRTTRQRLRFRFRLSVNAEVNDDVMVGIRLASGAPGEPISTNQTMTDLFTRAPIAIDRVFMAYTPSGVPGLTIAAGKFGIPVTRTELTFDSDLNWQGLYQQYRGSTESVSYRLVAAQAPVQESSSGSDSALFATYGEVGVSAGDHSVQVSVGNYAFREVDRIATTIVSKDIGRNTNQHQFSPGGAVVGFASGFNLVDVIARATLDTGRESYPVDLTADFVTNTDAATDEDSGVWVTAGYGTASTLKAYRLAYTYARIEQDAVLSIFNFSDIQGTNVRMNRIAVSYMVAPRVTIDFAGIFTKKLLLAPGESNALLKRTQVDVRVSF